MWSTQQDLIPHLRLLEDAEVYTFFFNAVATSVYFTYSIRIARSKNTNVYCFLKNPDS